MQLLWALSFSSWYTLVCSFPSQKRKVFIKIIAKGRSDQIRSGAGLGHIMATSSRKKKGRWSLRIFMVSVNLSPASRLSDTTFPRTSLVNVLNSLPGSCWGCLRRRALWAGLVGHEEQEEEHLALAEAIIKHLSYAAKNQMFKWLCLGQNWGSEP